MKICLPFHNDSSLIFASKLGGLLRERSTNIVFKRLLVTGAESEPSDRQVRQYLDRQEFDIISEEDATKLLDEDFDALVFSMPPQSIKDSMAQKSVRASRQRPAVVGFSAGLDFSTKVGARNRKNFDIVFLNSRKDVNFFLKEIRSNASQHVSFGHPYAILQKKKSKKTGNIYFFSQAISPKSLKSRIFILKVLIKISERNKNMNVFIKLRHLPGENMKHKHVEEFSYHWILNNFFVEIPSNLQFTACSTEEALADADYAITCTSTAAIDAISSSTPTMVYLDYIESHKDPLNNAMRRQFDESGLIVTLTQLVQLDAGLPNPKWMQDRFKGPELIDELLDAIHLFKERQTK